MDDIERAFDDAISTFKSTIKDQRFLPGAGATEIVSIINWVVVFGWKVRIRRLEVERVRIIFIS